MYRCYFINMELSVVLAIIVALCLKISTAADKPHIVFIVADDLGWNDVGWVNPDIKTPTLDRLAHGGVILNSSYVQPLCSPSRNCFMSGKFPYHTGLQDSVIFIDQPKYMPANLTTIPQRLKTLGYDTHMVGKWHLGFCDWKYTPTYRGFDTFMGYYGGKEDYFTHVMDKVADYNGYDFRNMTDVYKGAQGEYSTYVFAKRAIDIIMNHDKSKPMYLYLPFQAVHGPLQVPAKYSDRYSHIHDLNRKVYSGMVSALDDAVYNITTVLEDLGFMDNLLLVFTTDNGGPPSEGANNWPLRGGKSTLWEGGTRGAGFVYSKTLLKKKGYTHPGLFHAVDWYPTLLDIAGGDSSQLDIDGLSQVDMILNGDRSVRNQFVYNIYDDHYAAALRWGDLKLIVGDPGYSGWYPLPGFDLDVPIMDDSPLPSVMLYNISADPTEHQDISKDNPDLVNFLLQMLARKNGTRVPAMDPPSDPRSNPVNFNGSWSPGWC
ncbi:arylsulfatase I-like [Haliotis rufescens]|uniref:arylsulfatase I-like n=1 Tax=Haliotis rufescens TaxID=6454 RepID=UPI00201F851D|nr:arylsulfatase I-like [Haliotis rufescens]